MDARTYPAKATPKSLRTRARILDAAMRLFAQIGYHAASNAVIADASNLTRGAMLYHFATREELVEAAVTHIQLQRARLFEQAASAPSPAGVDAAEHAIDVYWSLLHELPFVAFAELEAAARTDAMLSQRLEAARSAFDHAQLGGDRFGAMVQAGADPRFQTSRDLGRFLLEGLAKGAMTYDEPARRARLLAVITGRPRKAPQIPTATIAATWSQPKIGWKNPLAKPPGMPPICADAALADAMNVSIVKAGANNFISYLPDVL